MIEKIKARKVFRENKKNRVKNPLSLTLPLRAFFKKDEQVHFFVRADKDPEVRDFE